MPDSTQYAYDGFGSILGGMNGAVAPTLVAEGQAWNMVNVASRGGKAGNRPRFVAVKFTFGVKLATNGTTVLKSAAAVQSSFLSSRFQGMTYYATSGDEWFYASIGGLFYRFTPQADGFLVEDMTPDAGNDPNAQIAYFCQADKYLVIQDGAAQATLVNGSYIRRSNPDRFEVPIGTFMAYGFGRLWLTVSRNSYLASDLIGERPGAPTTFFDGRYLNENSNFDLPPNLGRVRGMAFINIQDTATGDGALFVFGENGAESVDVSKPREDWLDSQIQREALTRIGATGHRSIVSINGDLWFRSHDGWRSYRSARAEQDGPNQIPQSTAIRPYTDIELPEELFFGSAISFNNRLIATCNPQRNNSACVHSGLTALDFDVLTTGLDTSSTPAWDGYWTAPAPVAQLITGLFRGRRRAFAFTTATTFANDGTSTVLNGMFEILEDGGPDVTGYNSDGSSIRVPITSTLETRGMSCLASLGAGSVYTEKLLQYIDVYEINREGQTEIKVWYREDGNSIYKLLADTTENAPPPAALGAPGGPLYTARSRSYVPDDTATGADTRLDRRFYDLQLKFQWTGDLQLHRVRVCGMVLPDSRVAGP